MNSHGANGLIYNRETRRRIRISVAAYAYEIDDDPIMSDKDYDKLASEINLHRETGNRKLDKFFKKHYSPHTGSWIRRHPELDKLKILTAEVRKALKASH